MKRLFFALGILFCVQTYSQQQIVYKNTVSNFNVTIPGLKSGIYGLAGGISIVSGAVLYKSNGIEHIIQNTTDSVSPPIHFYRDTTTGKWMFDNYYNEASVSGGFRNYVFVDTIGTIAFASTGSEAIQPWPLGDMVLCKTIGTKLVWTRISDEKSYYHSMGVGDVNGDGLYDAVGMGRSNDWQEYPHIYTQNSNGSFSESRGFLDARQYFQYGLSATYVGNLLKNKYPEIIIAEGPTGSVTNRKGFSIFSYDTTLAKYTYLTSPKDLGIYSNPGQGTTSIKSADFNNDGFTDLAIATEGSPTNYIQLWNGDGKGNFSPGQLIYYGDPSKGQTNMSFREFEVMDFNHDGWLDIVVHSNDFDTLFRVNPTLTNQYGTGIKLQNCIWQNNKGVFTKITNQIQINNIYPSFMKGFLINGDLRFFGFEMNPGNPPNFNKFILHDVTVHFCNNLIKPTFSNTKFSFCSGDSIKLSISNVNKGDTLKWFYGTKSDLSNVTNKIFTDSTKLFVTRTDSLGCVISSDTVSLIKFALPPLPFLSKDTTNHLVSSAKYKNTWYKDGSVLADTTQKITLSNNGYYTVKTNDNNCNSPLSIPYYYNSSFGQQQIVAKTKTYNFDVTNKNVTDSTHLNSALVRSQMVLYNVGKTQHLILNPNDKYYFPGYHFINKDGNWKYENMYNSLIMEGPYGYSVYDTLGNLAISSTGDEGRTVYGDLFSVQTSGDSLIANKINTLRRPFSDVSTGDINKDGKMDIVSYGGLPPNNQITTFIQNNSGQFNYDSTILERGDQITYKIPSIGSRIAYTGYAVTVSNLLSNNYPEIIRGEYSSQGGSLRYGVAIHIFNKNTGVYDSTKLITSLGVYADSLLGTTNIRVADLNNDGKKDLVIKYETPSGNLSGLQIFMNDGNNNFLPGQTFTFPPNKWNDGGFVLSDVNLDGWVDILLSPLSGTDFFINSSSFGSNTQGVKLQNSILLNNKGTFDFLKNNISILGPKPYYLKSNFINNQIKYVGIGFPDGNNGDPVLTAPSGSIKMFDFSVTFCNNLIKPTFSNTKFSFCSGDSLKLTISNVNKGDTLKWFYGTKSDLSNVTNKTFTDSTKLFVTRTDSLGCVISSDTVSLLKFTTPSAPVLSRDTANNLVASVNGITWYKDGNAITDTTQKIKPTTGGSYTAKTTQNGCISTLSTPYYYLVTDIINLSADEYIKLAPNPFTNQLNFDFVVKGYQRLNMEVFDLASGNKVASKQNLTPGIPIYLGQLTAGTYVIKVTSNDLKVSYQFKMVKL